MDCIRQRVQKLITKLQTKYGVQTKRVTPLKSFKKDGEDGGPTEDWFLVDKKHKRFCLPKTMLFMGRDECDVVVQCQSVDKRHAVVTYDHYLSRFKIKDLSTANGTFVNESRIPEQEYVTLNHMDSVRLGYDTMVYHVEQGGSASHTHTHTHTHMTRSETLPNWAVREPEDFIGMAECEERAMVYTQIPRGCIAEQQIHHTCVHQTEPNFVDMHRSFEKKKEDEKGLGSNTWPRKRLRQLRPHPHIASVFSEESQPSDSLDQSDCNVTNNGYYYPDEDGPHRPSCERSMYGEKDHGTSHVPACMCYTNSNIQSAEYLDYAVTVSGQTNGVTRIPRSGSRHILPPELETVKKGTPLYGQPDWWGEEDENSPSCPSSKPGSKRSSVVHVDADDHGLPVADRPRSLSLEQQEELARMEKPRGEVPEYGTRYMEIPHRVQDADREKETPPRSMSSSLSKDSLFSEASKMNTPDTPGDAGDRSSKEGTPDRRQLDTVNMAFTVDFGDDEKKVKKTLSECVPPKMRKSFRERKEKVQQKSQGSQGKSEEEREHSPAQQKKQEVTTSVVPEQKPVKKMAAVKKPGGDSSPPTRLAENGEAGNKTADSAAKAARSSRSKKSPSSRVATKSPKAKPSEVSTIDPTSYKDPTSFLIDKMFEGNGKLTKKSADNGHMQLTEHDLYRESVEFDIDSQNNVANGELLSANNLKPKKSKEKARKESDVLAEEKREKEDDRVSEAGTYTIEADEDEDSMEEVRKNIDRVFGLDDRIERPVIDVEGSEEEYGEGEVNHIDDGASDEEGDEGETTRRAEAALKRAFRDQGSSMEVEAGSADTADDLDIPDDIDLEDLSLAAMSTTDVPKWVSQWAALAKQRALKKSQSLDLDEGRLMKEASQKPPNGRKRPGTGRRLPSIPTDRSPCSSDYSSSRLSETSPKSGEVTPRQEDVTNVWPGESPTKPKSVTISSQVVTHYQETNGDTSARGRSGSGSDVSGDTSQRMGSPLGDSSRTSGSMDTEVLLKGTEDVMAAIEARIASRAVEKQHAVNGHRDDSDSDSMVAMVNGDDDFVKPTYYSSPRETLAKRNLRGGLVNTSTPKKPPLGKSLSVSRDQNVVKNTKNRSLSLDTSAVSDVYSESSELADSESYRSDVSSDVGISSQKGAKKGHLTNTKPNRAFQLRRAKADGPEDTPRSSSARSTSSAGSTSRTSTSRTSSSMAPTASSTARSAKSTTRSKSGLSGRYESSKSEVSLGGEIVKKSRENMKSPAAPASFERKDGGRHSLRAYKTNSQKTLSIFNPTAAEARKNDLKNLKTQLKKTEGSRGLSVTGHSARSQSQPSSRSNSPKAAERLAWKRRKQYDPRKAVAEAKAKAKDVPKVKAPLSQSQTSLAITKKRMFRSASFTNSAELSGHVVHNSYKHESISSAEDLSLTASEAADSFDERGLRRAFVPLSGPLRSDRMSHSADEDESSLSLNSSQDLSRSMLSNAVYKSAFTPPLPKVKSPAVATSPLPSSLVSRRRTLESIEYEDSPSRTSGGDSPQSYDTLLISSIYQLSLKLKTATDRSLNKLREHNRVSATPSPIDDFMSHTAKSEIPAWKSANQELAGILKNLRKIEHHQQVIDRVLFPDEDSLSEVSRISSREKQKYFQEIERIRSELAGFHFIDKPECEAAWKKRENTEDMSPDMEEIGEEEFY